MAISLFDAILRHQLYLEGLKAGQRPVFERELAKARSVIIVALAGMSVKDMGELNKSQLYGLIRSLRKSLGLIFDAESRAFLKFLESFVAADRAMWVQIFAATTGAPIAKLALAPSAAKIWSAAINTPMGANGILLEKFVEASRVSAVASVINTLSQARANRWSPTETAAKIVGTPQANGKDGVLNRIANQQAAVTNTVLQHLSSEANDAVGRQGFAEYEWVSVLDDKTTPICRDRDGKRYPYGKGPLPPAHVGCRSTVMPIGVNTGEVDYLDTFAKWAKATPETVLKDIFKDGEADVRNVKPLDLERFKAKQSNMTGKE